MRNILICSLLIVSFHSIFSQSSKHTKVGTVHGINASSREIIIATRAGSMQMGQKVFTLIGGKSVLLISTFPMMTKTNARLLPGYGRYLPEIKKGMIVYAYEKAIDSQSDQAVIKKSGSVSELAMLCGKPIESDNVKEYLAHLGSDYEESRPDQWLFYEYKKSGISVKFLVSDSVTRVSHIFLYNEGADKFRAYSLELPENLDFRDTRDAVEKKLGKPAEIKFPYLTLGVLYPAFGLRIDYATLSPDDMNAKIHHIVVGNPEIKD